MALVGIEKVCPICEMNFRYCEHCWRGHKYCSPGCSQEGRKKNRRASEKRYAATAKGRESRRRRQKNFRIRNILKLGVTDHSSSRIVRTLNCAKTNTSVTSDQCWHCQKAIRVVVGGRNGHSHQVTEEGDYFSFVRFRSKNG